MRIKFIGGSPITALGYTLAQLKNLVEEIYTIFKVKVGAIDVPVGMGYDGTIHKLVNELKSRGVTIGLRAATARDLNKRAVKYLNNKFPENVPGTAEHEAAYPVYYVGQV